MRPSPIVVAAGAVALGLLPAAGPPAAAANFNVTANPNLTFTPSVLTIQVGDSVTWTNSGGMIHNVVAADGSFRCANGCDGQGGNGEPATNAWSFTLTFNTPGTIGYYCQVHGAPGFGMTGQVIVEGSDEPGSLRFSQETYTVGEGGGQATITVQRVGGDDGAASVQYATGGGTAAAGADYGSVSGTLSWADNDDDPKTFNVPIVDDNLVEGTETVTLTLSGASGAALGTPGQATLHITDNDSPPGQAGSLQLSSATYTAGEGDGSVAVTVTRTGGTSGAVSVGYTSADGGAVSGLDYTAAAGTLQWANGDAAAKSFTVLILEDDEIEGDESFEVSLANPGGGATLGTPATAAVTIEDNDVASTFPCEEDAETLCLLGDRFEVQVDWRRANGRTGQGQAVPFTEQAGLFYFFDEDNLEMLVKMVDACGFNNHYWVFYAATTNVEFTVTVTDTLAGEAKLYPNPLGMAAAPIQDTRAFATCP